MHQQVLYLLNLLLIKKIENPLDNDGNNDYVVRVIAEDQSDNTSSTIVTLNIFDIDEIPPEITGLSGKKSLLSGNLTSTVSIKENLSSIGTFAANETVTWSISGGNDQDKFSIDASTGALSFKSAPDFETL